MPDLRSLHAAVDALVASHAARVRAFDTGAFLSAGVDPFRLAFNVAMHGAPDAIRHEVQHKLEMALENDFGSFHEEYLGNCTRAPRGSRWRVVPRGQVPGVDLANDSEGIYLQLKSKHNSMNSSSAKRLAQELRALKARRPHATVGCAWVVATTDRPCNGEGEIAAVGAVLKGKAVYDFVTGRSGDMDEVVALLPGLMADAIRRHRLAEEIDNIAARVHADLDRLARRSGYSIVEFIYNRSVS